MKKLVIILAIAASVGTMYAVSVPIDDVYYILDEANQTAKVTSNPSKYAGELVIPSSVTYNGVPYSVTGIEKAAFFGCVNLFRVEIPSSITTIEEGAFEHCDGLYEFVVASDNKNYCSVNGVLFNKDQTKLERYPAGQEGDYTIPNGVTKIGKWAFDRCPNLTSVEIPNSVIVIDSMAFSCCGALKSLTIGNSVTSINYSAFVSCGKLTSVTLPNSVTSLGDYAFEMCKGIKDLTLGNSITSIGEGAFRACENLTELEIPKSVVSIGKWAFSNCSKLTNLTIPNSVISVGPYAFYDCTSLISVTIGNSVTSIGERAFAGCSGLTSVEIPDNVSSIGGGIFINCTGLTSVNLGNGIADIREEAFARCTSLKNVEIPSSVTNIEEYAFHGCTGLTSVTIGNSVTSIGHYAFEECTGLTSIEIPKSVAHMGWGVFGYCLNLAEIRVETGSQYFSSVDGVLFSKDRTMLVQYPDGKQGSYTIPYGVTSVEMGAFYRDVNLTGVTIPNSVTKIKRVAFAHCTDLTLITCEATIPPTCEGSPFNEVEKTIPLYVPANYVDDYKTAYEWKEFGDNIKPIQATESTTSEIVAEAAENSVVVEWPAVTGATVYTIEIRKGEELVCTISFDEKGQLLSIDFTKKARANEPKNAVQTATGWQYTISGLEAGTTYSYTIIAKNGATELFNQTKQFTTTMPTAIEEVESQESRVGSRKTLRGGQLYILRGENIYTVTGQEVR